MSACTNSPRWRRHRRGFTLIEVAFVIAIATILAMLAAPSLTNLYRRSALSAEARRLYGAFIEAQGLATSEGYQHRLYFDRANRGWRIEKDPTGTGTWSTVIEHGATAATGDAWPDYVDFGPPNGISNAFPKPYDVASNAAWCTPCGAGSSNGSIIFDIDGRVLDPADSEPVNGAILLHDNTGSLGGAVEALVFIGATGNLRLFSTSE